MFRADRLTDRHDQFKNRFSVLVKARKYYTELQRLPRRISVRPPTKVEQIDCPEQGRHILSAPPLTLVISRS